MDYYIPEDMPLITNDLVIAFLIGLLSVISIVVFIFLIRWLMKK